MINFLSYRNIWKNIQECQMSYEKTVSATLMVVENLVEAVELEFRTTSKMKVQENLFRIRIVSTKTAICNWIVNLTEYIQIETTSDPSIIKLLCYRAKVGKGEDILRAQLEKIDGLFRRKRNICMSFCER